MSSRKSHSSSTARLQQMLSEAYALYESDLLAALDQTESLLAAIARELWRRNIDARSVDAARLDAAGAPARELVLIQADALLYQTKICLLLHQLEEVPKALEVAQRLAELLADNRLLGDLRIQQADALRGSAVMDERLQLLEEALELYTACDDPPARVKALAKLAQINITRGRLKESEEFVRDGLACDSLERFPQSHILLLNCRSSIASQYGDFEHGLEAAQQALKLADSAGRMHSRAGVLDWIGRALSGLGRNAEALKVHADACAIYRSMSRTGALVTSLQLLGIVYIQTGRFEEALKVFEQASEICRELGNVVEEARCYNNISNALQELGRYGRSLHFARKSLALHETLESKGGTAVAHSHIANSLSKMGRFDQALAHYHKATTIYRISKARFQEAVNLVNTAELYLFIEDKEKYFEFSEQAYRIAEQHHFRVLELWGMLNRGEKCEFQGDLQRAEEHFNASLKLSLDLGDLRGQSNSMLGLGRLHQQRGNFDEALVCINECLRLHDQMKDQARKSNARITLAQVHVLLGNYGQAHAALDAIMQEALAVNYLKVIPEVHKEKSAVYEAEGKLAEALKHFKLFNQKQRELLTKESREQLNNLQVAEELEKARHETELQKQQRMLVEKELDLQRRELMSHTMITSRNGELLREVYDNLHKLQQSGKKAGAEVKNALGAMLSKLEPTQQSAQDWEAFEQRFNKIHSTFIPKLRAEFPALSPVETKVCSLLKLNLNIKEMADLLSVGPDTIKKHRYNVRRKLGLQKGQNLSSFFADY